jgi:nitrite reductase/ring-hydroxylating ferredoxin subunit
MRIRVARLDEVPAGQPYLVEAEGTRIVLVRVGDAVHACDDGCTHHGGPLSEGKLSGTRLSCPWHGWMFDVRTGQCLMPSRGGAIPTYPVHVESGEIWVELPASPPPSA